MSSLSITHIFIALIIFQANVKPTDIIHKTPGIWMVRAGTQSQINLCVTRKQHRPLITLQNIKIPNVILIAEQYKSGSSIFTTYY